jgi:hypothetical protein
MALLCYRRGVCIDVTLVPILVKFHTSFHVQFWYFIPAKDADLLLWNGKEGGGVARRLVFRL